VKRQKASHRQLKEIASVSMGQQCNEYNKKIEFNKLDKACNADTLTPLINVRIATYSNPLYPLLLK